MYATYRALRNATKQHVFSNRMAIVAILAISLVWAAIAGTGHFFYANRDWIIRDAVLNDLSVTAWPTVYALGKTASSYLVLRAPIAYYLPAAAIGHLTSPLVASYALYAWTALGWGLVLTLTCSLFKTCRQHIACILIMTVFSGMDWLGHIWSSGTIPQSSVHIEWWMKFIQYSGNTTLLFWVPNHALPAWIGILLILRHWQAPQLARLTPLLATAIPLWSPFAAIGLFPFFLLGIHWKRDAKLVFSPHSGLPFVVLFLLTALYIGMDAEQIPHGWRISMVASNAKFIYRYSLFCLLEFAILALVLARIVPVHRTLLIAVLILAALPFYYYSIHNDLGMRASIPALTVLAITSIKAMDFQQITRWHLLLIGILAVGALGSMQEVKRAFLVPAWNYRSESLPDAILSERPTATNRFPQSYLARPESRGMHRLMRTPDTANQAHYHQ